MEPYNAWPIENSETAQPPIPFTGRNWPTWCRRIVATVPLQRCSEASVSGPTRSPLTVIEEKVTRAIRKHPQLRAARAPVQIAIGAWKRSTDRQQGGRPGVG